VVINRNDILEKIGIAINAGNVKEISKLVESAFDAGYTSEEIKDIARECIVRPDFDVICEFCRVIRFEENR